MRHKNSKAGSEIRFYRKYRKYIQTPELLGINYQKYSITINEFYLVHDTELKIDPLLETYCV